MDSKEKNFVLKFAKQYKKSIFRFLMSAISLIITMALFVTATVSWFTISTSELDVTRFQLDCGKGLRVNDSGTSQLSFSQTSDASLTPASSVDGRNLYFPTDGSDFSNITENITYRCANAGDKNKNYIQIDFTLTAQQNHTALYINEEKTSLKVRSGNEEYSIAQAASLRSALWSSTEENGVPNTPIVFNPTASTVYTAAVADVDRNSGSFISTGRQVAHTFSEYSFGGTPVATLSRNVKTKFSYIIWLEGADPKCTDRITSKDIEIRLAFTTSWDKTQTIRFEDQTGNDSIKNLLKEDGGTYRLSLAYYEDTDTLEPTEFNMWAYNNNDNVWSCNIPGDMRNKITFFLRPISGEGTVYEFTKDSNDSSKNTFDRGSNRLYVAKTLDGLNSSGYWKAIGDSDGAGHDSGGNFDGDDF